jgi:hypothetical protein
MRESGSTDTESGSGPRCYPTFAEAYKVAALDALNKLRAISLA